MTDKTKLRMDAYYYGFEETGDRAIDELLSAIAHAGKAYHNTEGWNDELYSDYSEHYPHLQGETVTDWIQNAANRAANKKPADHNG